MDNAPYSGSADLSLLSIVRDQVEKAYIGESVCALSLYHFIVFHTSVVINISQHKKKGETYRKGHLTINYTAL